MQTAGNSLSTQRGDLAKVLASRLARRLVEVPQWQFITAEPDERKIMYELDREKHIAWLYWHYGQLAAWESKKRFILVQAGTQSGKTSFGPWWQIREVLNTGGGDHLAVSVSYDLFKLKLLPEMREVLEHSLNIGRYWAGDQIIEIRNPRTGKFDANTASDKMWGRIILRSATAKGGLESASAKSVYFDEAGHDDVRVAAWEAIERRITLYHARVLLGTTPYNLGWMKQRIYDKAEAANFKHPEYDVISFPSSANPAFSEDEMRRARESMPLWKYLMFYEGKYTRPAGLIYEDFVDDLKSAGGHKVKPFNIPQDWPRIVGIDPGVINQAEVWGAIDVVNNHIYLYRAIKQARKPQEQHAREALKRAADGKENVIKWAIGAKSEIYHREDWQAAGASPVLGPDTNDVEEGIDRVTLLLKQFRLFIFDDLHGLLEEMVTYSREVDEEGNATEKIRDKSTFHLLDALRYLAMAYVQKLPNYDIKVKVGRYV